MAPLTTITPTSRRTRAFQISFICLACASIVRILSSTRQISPLSSFMESSIHLEQETARTKLDLEKDSSIDDVQGPPQEVILSQSMGDSDMALGGLVEETTEEPPAEAYKVSFLRKGEDFASMSDLYSGTWWQSRAEFMDKIFQLRVLEDATYGAVGWNMQRMKATKDWFDLNVEHLSKFFKQIEMIPPEQRAMLMNTTTEIFTAVLDRMEAFEVQADTPPPSTLVLFPLVCSQDAHAQFFQVATTLVSLWRIGMGRVTVVVPSEKEEDLVSRATEALSARNKLEPMVISCVHVTNVTAKDRRIWPKVALAGLQVAMRGDLTESETVEWLGTDPERWKYVYFTEPDLILHTRQKALPSLFHELREGNILMPIRLQPLVHARDFPGFDGYDLMTPNFGKLGRVLNMEPLDGDSCCDAGRFYPANWPSVTTRARTRRQGDCGDVWWMCGFWHMRRQDTKPNIASLLWLHRRLLAYPILSLQSGTGVPVVAGQQRVCVPRRGMTCDEPVLALPPENIPTTTVTPREEQFPASGGIDDEPDEHDGLMMTYLNSSYSGFDAWWQSRSAFLASDLITTHSAEDRLQAHSPNQERMTKDWLDFSVERLSQPWNHFRGHPHKGSLDNQGCALLEQFLSTTDRGSAEVEVLTQSTIAVIPLALGAFSNTTTHFHNLALAGSLTSLARAGFGRVVIYCSNDSDAELVERAIAMSPELDDQVTEIAVVRRENQNSSFLLDGLTKLRGVLQGEGTVAEVREWLGDDASRWRYIYVSKPFLVFVSRPSAVQALLAALDKSMVLVPHRWEWVPHARSFPGVDAPDLLLPPTANFDAAIQVLDPLSPDACCDVGDYYGANLLDPRTPAGEACPEGLPWYLCGFGKQNYEYNDTSHIFWAHLQLQAYPLISLSSGTGATLVSRDQRVCLPMASDRCR